MSTHAADNQEKLTFTHRFTDGFSGRFIISRDGDDFTCSGDFLPESQFISKNTFAEMAVWYGHILETLVEYMPAHFNSTSGACKLDALLRKGFFGQPPQ